VGVVLTGANGDGAYGIARIKTAGGMSVVQDPATARAPEMPQAALDAAAADRILPLEEIAPFLNGLGRAAAR
jgi:two-component system chemotaxis response regulator CheB